MTRFQLRRAMIAGVAMLPISGVSAPASAQFFGGIVYDPTNYAQNVLTAARSLQQINNQIQSLQNEASSLINQARNLASLPFSSLQQLQGQIQQTRQLLSQAQRIAYDVQQIDQAFTARYRGADLNASDQTLIANAKERWETSLGGFEDALTVQAGVGGNLDVAPPALATLCGATTGRGAGR